MARACVRSFKVFFHSVVNFLLYALRFAERAALFPNLLAAHKYT